MLNSLVEIFDLKEKNSYAIVGNFKNAGKTTVLNKLLGDISKMNKKAGISSIGWDGETIDRVYKTEKPAVIIPKNSFAATCKMLLPVSSNLFKIHNDTGIETILGSIYIIEALNDMKIEIVGPRDLVSTKETIIKLKELADYVILDGALNRNTSASSFITDGFILSILYNWKESLSEFEKSLLLFYEKYNKIDIVDNSKIKVNTLELIENNVITVGFGNDVYYFDFGNPIHNEEKLLNIIKKPDWIYLPGSLTDLTIEKLSNFFVDIDIIIDDFTKNFLSSKFISILKNRNCNIYYLFSSKLMGITVSTWTSSGIQSINPKNLISLVKSIFKGYVVVDLFYN